uniref:U3 small nucleolar RNA-associated protein 14 homolog A n=1 Tax=Timema genevievae TaxID=629358 RepID=A0A7R9K2L1_TIMGE|nr:unnamed protein product [Timema genevievae]
MVMVEHSNGNIIVPENDSDFVDSDNEVNEKPHTVLLEAISQLGGKQRVKPPTRKEPSLQVSEFHLVKRGTGFRSDVNLNELVEVLGQRSSHAKIGRKLQSIQKKSKTLKKPLEKSLSEKIQRSLGFENVKKELGKWDAVVHKNRSSDSLSFPLNRPDSRVPTSNALIANWKSQKPTPMEAQLEEILSGSAIVQEDRKAEEVEYPLSLEEMIERRKEMAKLRAVQSFQAAKAVRQKKIKSKKYHRLQRRENVRKQLKNFEQLKKEDPEAALKQLEQIERSRAEERMTLRHRSTGKWAHSKAIRAKSEHPDLATRGDEGIDDEEDEEEMKRYNIVAEAFADDNVVADFSQEKKEAVVKSTPQNIDLSMPGWGDWAGQNISVSKRKKRRFVIKIPKDAPRRDENKGNVIINQEKDIKVKQHQVSDLPFPFESVKDFEASIRAPIGNNWVPEMAHRKMIRPEVLTMMGTVIQPMDNEALIIKKKKGGRKSFFPV